MNRCSKSLFASFFVALCVVLSALTATFVPLQAHAQRMFPQKVERGTITFTGSHDVVLNDKRERLAPGAIVRTERNTIALSGSLRGKTFTANYLRDPMHLVREVWLLTPAEAERPLRPKLGVTATPDTPADPLIYRN